jgi:hypothetical protein
MGAILRKTWWSHRVVASRGGRMPGTTVTVAWRGRPVDAFVPVALSGLPEPSRAALRAAALAEGALSAVEDRLAHGLEVPARLLLRAEGVASSRIEALHAPVGQVAVADVDDAVGGAAGWVADNLRAIDAALAHTGPLRADDLWQWHRLLMQHGDLEDDLVGRWRDRLGWIGGLSPHRAAHVAAPEDAIDGLMRDLVDHCNRDDHDPVTQAALVHAQFETIHPFADGNGRLGRLLIGWIFHRRLGITVPPPLSLTFARDIGGYLAGLTRFRQEGPDPWIRWFAGAVEHTARTTDQLLTAATAVIAAWPERVADIRRDAAAHTVLPLLPAHPALDVVTTASLTGVSESAARAALEQLTARGILRVEPATTTSGPGRPRRWWVAGELLDALAG